MVRWVASVRRPPSARETVPRYYAFKQPISYTLTVTTKL